MIARITIAFVRNGRGGEALGQSAGKPSVGGRSRKMSTCVCCEDGRRCESKEINNCGRAYCTVVTDRTPQKECTCSLEPSAALERVSLGREEGPCLSCSKVPPGPSGAGAALQGSPNLLFMTSTEPPETLSRQAACQCVKKQW